MAAKFILVCNRLEMLKKAALWPLFLWGGYIAAPQKMAWNFSLNPLNK